MIIPRYKLPDLLEVLVGRTVVCKKTYYYRYKVGDVYTIQYNGRLGETAFNGMYAEWLVLETDPPDLKQYM